MTIKNIDVYTGPESRRGLRFIDEFDTFLPLEDHHSSKSSMSAEAHHVNAEGLVHSLIEQRAKAFPDATALQFERQTTMTYRQLNETANAVAKQLVCGRGAFIPIATQRSFNLVVALLAVMKTGAAYVLLSPDAPDKRNEFIVEDLRAPFVITDATTQGRFGRTTEISIEDLVAESERMSTAYRTNLNIYQAHSDYAYVVYTSGTTGNPKGVLLSHRAACTGLSALPSSEAAQSLRQLLCYSPNFSAAQRTILGTLRCGGTLCLASKENLMLNLPEMITDMAISTLEITPSMLKLIDHSTIPENVRKITLGGECANSSLVDMWAGRVELFSAYGLSECTQLNMRQRLWQGRNPRLIGKPSDTTTAYVLAPNGTTILPPGVPGELCLAGPQLSDGYLNLPEKTHEVFKPNPFGPGMLYHTGDMVTAREDGTFEIIGRMDQQIKIDGQRVEPNESNSILETCGGVSMSSVVSAKVLNRRALVALVVPEKHIQWTSLVRELRANLVAKIPAYAIPAYWVRRDALPLNVSGKIDVAALVTDVEALGEAELITRQSSAPITQLATPPLVGTTEWLEFQIAEVVASVLSISTVAVDLDSSFQELGGTSLDSIVAASRLRQQNIHVSVPDILQSSCLREMALRCTARTKPDVGPPSPFSLLPQATNLNLDRLEDAYPVTALQEGIIADSLLGNSNYVYQRVYKLQGLTPSQIRQALVDVISRNPIFRTSFVPWKRTFLQMVKKSASLPWKVMSDSTLEFYNAQMENEDMPLDGPLVRGAVLRDNLLVLDMHHALFDHWSSQFIFVDAISILQGREPIIRSPFSTYVVYQQSRHDVAAKLFWKNYLGGATPSVLDIPVSETVFLPAAIVSPLNISPLAFCSSHGVTLGALLHAAWALTLSTELEVSDVLFLTAFSGRDADIEGILALNGPTLCTAPMRVHVDDDVSALTFTKAVQQNLWTLSQYAHSGLRNALMESELRPDNFNTMVNVLASKQVFPDDSPLLPVHTHGNNFIQYPTIEIDENDPTNAKLLVQSRVDPKAAQLILDRFVRVVDFIVSNPDGLIDDFISREATVVQSSICQTDESIVGIARPYFGLAHAAFESLARTIPSKVAIRSSTGVRLSYGELDAKANSLANWLVSHGVKHGEMIPLYMEKSPATLVAIFGILKAGASFTPLDPHNSHDRNAFIIKDATASRIITDKKNQTAALAFGVDTILPEQMNLDSCTNLPPIIPELMPDSVIYAIYTSGSTGLPKGVLVTHSAVTASAEGMIEATGVTSEWNSLWVLNYVFDASYYDVFTIFSTGGTLCLAPQEEMLSNLAEYINKMEIQQVMLTPTITKLIRGGPSEVPGLKLLNVCGERIDVNILEWAKSVEVYNGYGPTEATILTTVSKVEPDGSLNSIGFPLKHAMVVILPEDGDSLEPVPNGRTGELCVRGPHLAKGYLNRPEQTGAVFVRDKDGEMLYRTGDLAHWNIDGSLECLGRKDYQVKLNGFRIELGEIENAILKTRDVEACVVSVAEVQGKRQLIAFCIFKGDHQPGIDGPLAPAERLDKVLNHMSKLTTIAHYMMPALFLPFGCLPTLPSGKVNRNELVALVERMQKSDITQYIPLEDSTKPYQPVSTKQERVMQKAWATVLDVSEESIGATSGFLSLGGDSISAINVAAECRKLSYMITVGNILSNPTLAEQAKHLKTAKPKGTVQGVRYDIPKSILSALSRLTTSVDQYVEDIFPCGPGQVEFLIQGHTKHQFWNLTACRELPEDFDLKLWLETTKALTARNQILRTMYLQADHSDPGSWFQIVLNDPILDWGEILYNTQAEKVRYMEELRDSLFTFGKPGVKYRLLQSLLDGSRTLCIKMEHGSYDGTLLRIFDEQFTAIAGDEPDLRPVHPFKQFINWTHSADRNTALQFWTKYLDGYTAAHRLPLEPVTNGLIFSKVKSNVNDIAAQYGVTPSIVFQAAYSVIAGQLCDTTDVVVDNLITGRNADVENPQLLNGTCANFLPFRSRLRETESIEQLLRDTQTAFWNTTEHGTVGLHDIYKALGQDRQVHSSKMLYCFQPFEPAPQTSPPTPQNHMRWLVMAQSKVYMTINYAVMIEVQKTATGYRFKLQYDSRALNAQQANAALELFDTTLGGLSQRNGRVKDLLSIKSALSGIWKL